MIAEKAFLGTIIKHNYLLKDTKIRSEQLEDARHQQLLNSMKWLSQDGKSINVVTLSTVPNLEGLGGISYINELTSFANSQKFEEYESLVQDAWKEREKNNILTRASQEGWEIGKVITELDAINEIKVDDYTSINDSLAEVYDAPWQKQAVKKGVPTGIAQLNRVTNGFQSSEVTVIAARPSMGKTDVLCHFSKQAGWNGYLPIIFSLEMPADSIRDRLIASTGRFNRLKMKDPYERLTEHQKNNWNNVLGNVSITNIQIFDGAGQTISEMRAKTRKMIHSFPDKKPIIFIDYLTLIRSENFFGGNAHLQVTEISKNLKAMAKEFNCPVVTLAQLNRSVEQRSDKRPMMSDIRESGSVEQDADLIMFLYREKYYNKDSDDNTLELIIAKNRNGPVGTVRVQYNEHTGEITDDNGKRAV
ncbi:replicative DNA helicase [Schinkia azotoformans MEV2011]|uniref:DNA 5'-3' helicase n=1 Tax=Schinkia azotoformans MEV2011 TaxID=1348973 RepID=A0A072NSF8_SCHAZ|nr:DnaB-like helicase C-terminal domain-containing protein [Schinkia azotoformans]KEF40147.1 replicative DNA helicase [Schinkia azotoformans MEV2011]